MKQDRAIVIGASMGGLLAARVLADHYRQVKPPRVERKTNYLPKDQRSY